MAWSVVGAGAPDDDPYEVEDPYEEEEVEEEAEEEAEEAVPARA